MDSKSPSPVPKTQDEEKKSGGGGISWWWIILIMFVIVFFMIGIFLIIRRMQSTATGNGNLKNIRMGNVNTKAT